MKEFDIQIIDRDVHFGTTYGRVIISKRADEEQRVYLLPLIPGQARFVPLTIATAREMVHCTQWDTLAQFDRKAAMLDLLDQMAAPRTLTELDGAERGIARRAYLKARKAAGRPVRRPSGEDEVYTPDVVEHDPWIGDLSSLFGPLD